MSGSTCPDILLYAETMQGFPYLVKTLLLTLVNGRVNVTAMEYGDGYDRLVATATSTGSDMPRAVERSDVEATGAFLSRQDRLSQRS